MNIWECIILINKTYWWAWAVLFGLCTMTYIIENCPKAGKLLDGAIEKIFHVDFNMDDEF